MIKKFISIINLKKNYEYLILFFFIILTSFLETLTIGLFFPFVSVLISGSTSITSYNFLENFFSFDDFKSNFNENELILFLLFIFLGVFIVKNLLVIYFNWYRENFNFSLRHLLSRSIFQNHILKKNSFFIKKNSSEYTSQTIIQSSQAVDSINAFIFLINEIIVFTFIFIFLLFLNYKITLISVLAFTIFIVPFLIISKIKMKNWASKKIVNEKKQIQDLNESFSMFKYLKIHQLEKKFFEKYRINNYLVNYYSKWISFLFLLPRYILEILTVCLISFVIIYFIYQNKSAIESLPLLAVFLLSASRMLPSINRISNSLQSYFAGIPAINSISREINKKNLNFKEEEKNFINFRSLEFQNISFSYLKNNFIFKNISLKIKAGDKIIIKGPSGVGKSSLIEILMGLQEINSGNFYLNNLKLKNFEIYKKIHFNYLPQSGYIVDDTIKNNITMNNKKLTKRNFRRVLEICNLNKFLNNLKKRENTKTGENGVTLSGGQKQRICLARALANDPSFLILDESTNAIDPKTERDIFSKLIKEFKKLTLIVVTHRNTDSKFFDKIINMKNKKIIIKSKKK